MDAIRQPVASRALDAEALDIIFHQARTANGFLPVPVSDEVLKAIVETSKFGPTAGNAGPMRVVFVASDEGRERLKPTLAPGNVEKAMSAPVTAIIARDLNFHEHMPRLFPHAGQQVFDKVRELGEMISTFNGTLQAAYFLIAARAHGLDTGPMGGFDNAAVDREFFPDGTKKSLLLITLGYGDDTKLFPRNPRLNFDEIASFA